MIASHSHQALDAPLFFFLFFLFLSWFTVLTFHRSFSYRPLSSHYTHTLIATLSDHGHRGSPFSPLHSPNSFLSSLVYVSPCTSTFRTHSPFFILLDHTPLNRPRTNKRPRVTDLTRPDSTVFLLTQLHSLPPSRLYYLFNIQLALSVALKHRLALSLFQVQPPTPLEHPSHSSPRNIH